MSVYKTFQDENGNKLRVCQLNNQDCRLICGDLDNDSVLPAMIILDIEDLSELIIELQFIKKQLQNNE